MKATAPTGDCAARSVKNLYSASIQNLYSAIWQAPGISEACVSNSLAKASGCNVGGKNRPLAARSGNGSVQPHEVTDTSRRDSDRRRGGGVSDGGRRSQKPGTVRGYGRGDQSQNPAGASGLPAACR